MVTIYKELEIFRKSYVFVLDVYKILESLPEHESHNVVDQMKRAATSIPLNIAEGASSMHRKVFLQRLGYAYESAKEVEVLLMLCRDLKYIALDDYKKMNSRLEKIRIHIFRFIRAIEKQIGCKDSRFKLENKIKCS